MRLMKTEMLSFLELPKEAQGPAMRLVLALQKKEDKDALFDLLAAVRRDRQRYESDKGTDPERRILVGPRLPRRMVDRYRAAAARQGVSLYRWSTDALESHLMEQERKEAQNDPKGPKTGPEGGENGPITVKTCARCGWAGLGDFGALLCLREEWGPVEVPPDKGCDWGEW